MSEDCARDDSGGIWNPTAYKIFDWARSKSVTVALPSSEFHHWQQLKMIARKNNISFQKLFLDMIITYKRLLILGDRFARSYPDMDMICGVDAIVRFFESDESVLKSLHFDGERGGVFSVELRVDTDFLKELEKNFVGDNKK